MYDAVFMLLTNVKELHLNSGICKIRHPQVLYQI